MARYLYEEYYGGEFRDTKDPKSRVFLNRAEYRLLDSIMQEKGMGSPKQEHATLDMMDSGAQALNLRQVDEAEFRSRAEEQGLTLVDRRFFIRRPITTNMLSGPRGAFLELTPDCYLRCAYCYNEQTRSSGKKRMKTDRMHGIIDELSHFGATSLAATGGETTAHPEWFEIVSHAQQNDMSVRFYTCGVYPKDRDKTLAKLVELSPNEIRISYAGLKEMNDRVRVSNQADSSTFDRITQTVEDLVNSGSRVKLNYTLSHQNVDTVRGFLEFVFGMIQKTGRDIPVNIGPLRAYGSAGAYSEDFGIPTAEDILAANRDVRAARQNYGMRISTVFDCEEMMTVDEIVSGYEKLKDIPWPYLPQGCGLGRAGIGVGYDGYVSVCGIMGDAATECVARIVEKNPDKYEQAGINADDIRAEKLTDLTKASVEDVWYGSPILSFFRSFYKKAQCEPCEKYRVQCIGICPGMALYHSGDIRRGDEGCPKPLLRQSSLAQA
jgi:MoaA/NifB/PqqE/SkfB family radical SAM enzyme